MNLNQWKEQVETFVQQNAENIARDIKRLVDIPSVEESPVEGAPLAMAPVLFWRKL